MVQQPESRRRRTLSFLVRHRRTLGRLGWTALLFAGILFFFYLIWSPPV